MDEGNGREGLWVLRRGLVRHVGEGEYTCSMDENCMGNMSFKN